MKALTICQPYAHLIAIGDKRVENRSWPTRYRGPIAVHAGKSRKMLAGGVHKRYPEMAFGAVVATAILVDCAFVGDIYDGLYDDKYPWLETQKNYISGAYCWLLDDIKRIDPAPCKGALSLWEWEALY